MKKLFFILIAIIGMGVSVNGQAYQRLNIESNSSRYEREAAEAEARLRKAEAEAELERLRSGNSNTKGLQPGSSIVNPNANVLQKNSYSNEKVLVYIENKSNSYRANCSGQKKADELKIENLSSSTITVKYCFRHLLFDCSGYQVQEKTTYREATLQPGEKKIESGYLSNGKIGYYYVDSFSVMYTKY